MLPVDFPDRIASTDPREDMKAVSVPMSDYYMALSKGKLRFNFYTLDRYVRLAEPSTRWGMGAWGQGNGWLFINGVKAEVDPTVDFSKADVLVVMTPPTIASTQIAWSPAFPHPAHQPLITGERLIFSSTMMGADAWNPNNGWMTLAHEFGHLLGWSDLYVLPYPSTSYADGQQYVGKWDFLGFAWNKGLLGWHRLYQDWLAAGEALCVNGPGTFTTWLSPLGSESTRPELLLLRGASGKLVAIESRRPSATDDFVTTSTQGALVYTVDADVPTGGGPLRVQGINLDVSRYLPSAPLRLGQVLVIDGWKIEVVETGFFGDVLKTTREG